MSISLFSKILRQKSPTTKTAIYFQRAIVDTMHAYLHVTEDWTHGSGPPGYFVQGSYSYVTGRGSRVITQARDRLRHARD